MERHFLEKASWVAGIVSAVITLVVWIKPENSASASPPKQKQANVAPAPTPISSKEIVKPPEAKTQTAATPNASTRWSCEGIAARLEPAYEAAKKISYTDPRDKAFLSLARKALCLENYEMFEKAAKQIGYTNPRDEAYGDAVDFTLNLRKFDLADKYAKQIAYTDPRDAAMARIVAKASERYGYPSIK
jgi:hypothetical protein